MMSDSSSVHRHHADEPKCILLVEDEFLIRMMFADELRDEGYRVIEARNADEALVIIDGSLPDLVITDVRMPGSTDGLGLLAKIGEVPAAVPVIVMSGHIEAERAIAGGAALFLRKPFAAEAIVEGVKLLLGERR